MTQKDDLQRTSKVSHRQLRVGEILRHQLADILRDYHPSGDSIDCVHLTITEVRLSPDLRHAYVFFTPLGGGEGQDALLGSLKNNRRQIRHELASRVDLKFLPSLKFILDNSFDHAQKIDHLFRAYP